jgi:uncharacterized protein YndB with AHSA1/START domain
MSAAADTKGIVVERTMPHPREKIWRALTEGPLIDEWLMKSDFEPIVGKRFTFRTQPYGEWDGVVESEVLKVEPPEALVYRWDSGGVFTVVAWTLTPVDGGTMLRMEQTGFRAEQDINRKGAVAGWNRFIDNLNRVTGGL